ncbi:glutamine synthetase [candidate division WOR-3 bacterium]|nr:glutamine synthetase [candidate division WOR-3 bacterium]
MDRTEVLSLVESKEVKAIRLWFTDILGRVKGFSMSPDDVERALDDGINFDGSSIEGFVRIEESDLIAKPDLNSTYLIPEEEGKKSLIFICDIYYPDGKPVESSPRYILKEILKKAEKMGFKYFTGAELEFFYFSDKGKIQVGDMKGYFDIVPYDLYDGTSEEITKRLKGIGIEIEMEHHEVAENQHELDLRYEEAIKMADHLQVTKYVIKETAREKGAFVTFMPKPIFGVNGSGLHIHQSLFKDNQNVFFKEDENYHLSEIARYFIAGVLKYSKEITSVTNQWVNSYKRLVPGYEAPVYISWGRQNRSALLRVPSFKPHNPSSCRFEYRAPDPGINPYLCFSVMLGAGLKGIEDKLLLTGPIEEDIYTMSEEKKKDLCIDILPDSLYAAIIETEGGELVKELFGEIFFRKYIQNKKTEWENYRIQVTDYEREKYISL